MQIGKHDPRSRLDDSGTERAVSPVIGVILMVAITVILAAVIGVFVLGLGDELGDTAPSTNLALEEVDTDGVFTLVHESGDPLDGEEIAVVVDGTTELEAGHDEFWDGELTAGEDADLNTGVTGNSDATVRIVHEPSGTTIHEEEEFDLDAT